MKKTFKKLVGVVLVAATIVTAMSVSMATQVFAAVNSYEFYRPDKNTVVNTDDYFTASSSTLNGSTVVAGTFVNLAEETINTQDIYATKFDGSGSLKFNVVGTAEVTIVASTRATKGAGSMKINLSGTNIETFDTNDTAITTHVTTLGAGAYEIVRGNAENALYYVQVVDTVSDDAKEYTINGYAELYNSSFTLSNDAGNYNVEIDEYGQWTLSITAVTPPFKVGGQFTVSKGEYAVTPETVTLVAGIDEETFGVADIINFTKLELTALADGDYTPTIIKSGRPNFDIDNVGSSSMSDKEIKLNDGTYVDFMVDENATVTVTYKCGSTSEGRDATPSIVNADTGEVIKTGDKSIAGDPLTTFATELTEAGTYRLVSKTTGGTSTSISNVNIAYGTPTQLILVDGKGALYVCGDDTYIIAGINEESLVKDYVSVGISVDKMELRASEVVYQSAVIEGNTITAGDINFDYLYAIKIANANGATDINFSVTCWNY